VIKYSNQQQQKKKRKKKKKRRRRIQIILPGRVTHLTGIINNSASRQIYRHLHLCFCPTAYKTFYAQLSVDYIE